MAKKAKKIRTLGEQGKKSHKRNFLATLVIIVILICGYFYIKDVEYKEQEEEATIIGKTQDYYFLENNDSVLYIARIMIEKNTNIFELSNIFYKNKIFWPYIFDKNADLENPLYIQKGTIVIIPKVKENLLNISNQSTMDMVKHIGDSILDTIAKKKDPGAPSYIYQH